MITDFLTHDATGEQEGVQDSAMMMNVGQRRQRTICDRKKGL